MASDKDYLNFVLELLHKLNNISYKYMMGEYLLYSNGVLFGGIYDNRFLIKITPSNIDKGLKEALPYEGAKNMYLIDSEDDEVVYPIIINVIKDLK